MTILFIVEYALIALSLAVTAVIEWWFWRPRKTEGFFTLSPWYGLSEMHRVPLKAPKLGKRPITFISDFEYTLNVETASKYEFGFGPYMYGIGGYKFELDLNEGDRVEISGKRKTRINDVVVRVVPLSEARAPAVKAARLELIEIEKNLR